MPGEKLQQRAVQAVEVEEFRGRDKVDAAGKAGINARSGNVHVRDRYLVFQLVFENVGFGEEQGVLLHVSGSHAGKAEAGGQHA